MASVSSGSLLAADFWVLSVCYIQTPLAPLWTFMFFAELPTAYTVAGGVIILVALFGSQWYGRYKKSQGV
jgi:drug/metabolite transporter (DMT)-like permease